MASKRNSSNVLGVGHSSHRATFRKTQHSTFGLSLGVEPVCIGFTNQPNQQPWHHITATITTFPAIIRLGIAIGARFYTQARSRSRSRSRRKNKEKRIRRCRRIMAITITTMASALNTLIGAANGNWFTKRGPNATRRAGLTSRSRARAAPPRVQAKQS